VDDLYLEQKFATCLLAKLVPLSEMMVGVKPEVTTNVLPMELYYLLSCDFGERHRLYPLGEVVGGNQ